MNHAVLLKQRISNEGYSPRDSVFPLVIFKKTLDFRLVDCSDFFTFRDTGT